MEIMGVKFTLAHMNLANVERGTRIGNTTASTLGGTTSTWGGTTSTWGGTTSTLGGVVCVTILDLKYVSNVKQTRE